MRRMPAHGADADIDAGLAKINRRKPRVRIGQVQDTHIAEAADVIKIVPGCACDAGRDARSSRDGEATQEIPAIQSRMLPSTRQ